MNELNIINELNNRLKNIQTDVNNEDLEYAKSQPSTFIVGCPRSGTTALLQYLSSIGNWSYPTNLLTRFSSSVYIGTLIQELLFNSEFGLIKNNECIDFESNYGRSTGPLNANEFFHFFRRFFPCNDICHLSNEELKLVDVVGLIKEINTIERAIKKPFLSKGLMFQYNLDYFHRYMPNDIFIYIKRDERFVMRSIYKARIKESGDITKWWSAKPKEYEYLMNKSVEDQIAGQVSFTNNAIKNH